MLGGDVSAYRSAAVRQDPEPWNARNWTIDPVAAVNLLVGPNNSGKSRFLRSLATADRLEVLSAEESAALGAAWAEGLAELTRCVEEAAALDEAGGGWLDISQIARLDGGDLAEPGARSAETQAALGRIRRALEDALASAEQAGGASASRARRAEDLRERFQEAERRLRDALSRAASFEERFTASPDGAPRRVYVPCLRTLRLLGGDPLGFHFKQMYFGDHPQAPVEVFTGSDICDKLTQLVLGGLAGRQKLTEFEGFLSQVCFGGLPVGISPHEKGGQRFVEVQIGSDPPRRIEDLGEGVGEVILLTFPVFFEPGRLFLIEEPEGHLHPALQRVILKVYAQKARESGGMFFITTHSSALIDTALEELDGCAVLRFRKDGDPTAAGMEGGGFVVSSLDPAEAHVLAELGARASALASVSATVWVEGPLQRLYVARLLELYGASPGCPGPLLEDLHYSFVQYGGPVPASDVLAEAAGDLLRAAQRRLLGQAVVIADADGGERHWQGGERVQALGGRFLAVGQRCEDLLPRAVRADLRREAGEDADLGPAQVRSGLRALSSFDELEPDAQAFAIAVYDVIRELCAPSGYAPLARAAK